MTSPEKKPVTGWQRSLVINLDKLIYAFSRRWVTVFNVVAAIYVGLPILAPVLMQVGLSGPGRTIYTMYGPMCHQMASRSFFLFGEQYAYPRDIAGTDLTPIETYMAAIPEFEGVSTDPALWPDFLLPAREFLGNDTLGYKMALCERDIAIYAFVVLGGLMYAFLRRRRQIKPLPILAFVIIGMGPIGLDGFSQLFSQFGTANEVFAILNRLFPLRESTPFLRTFTGALFGFSLVWLIYPRVADGMKETEEEVGRKLRSIGELPPETKS